MSVDLHDLKRVQITEETIAWLRAESHHTGKSQQQIAREALHEIALDKIEAAKLLVHFLPRDAHDMEGRGRIG